MRLDQIAPRVSTLYVYRPLLNYREIFAWARSQGFEETLKPTDFHTTIAYSRTPLDWSLLTPDKSPLRIEGGRRHVKHLGDKGAVVLSYPSNILTSRWRHFRDSGASWDWDDYTPHITITYRGKGISVDTVAPFAGSIVLGGEQWKELDLNWTDGAKHVATQPSISG